MFEWLNDVLHTKFYVDKVGLVVKSCSVLATTTTSSTRWVGLGVLVLYRSSWGSLSALAVSVHFAAFCHFTLMFFIFKSYSSFLYRIFIRFLNYHINLFLVSHFCMRCCFIFTFHQFFVSLLSCISAIHFSFSLFCML